MSIAAVDSSLYIHTYLCAPDTSINIVLIRSNFESRSNENFKSLSTCYATKLNRDERTENETMLHV